MRACRQRRVGRLRNRGHGVVEVTISKLWAAEVSRRSCPQLCSEPITAFVPPTGVPPRGNAPAKVLFTQVTGRTPESFEKNCGQPLIQGFDVEIQANLRSARSRQKPPGRWSPQGILAATIRSPSTSGGPCAARHPTRGKPFKGHRAVVRCHVLALADRGSDTSSVCPMERLGTPSVDDGLDRLLRGVTPSAVPQLGQDRAAISRTPAFTFASLNISGVVSGRRRGGPF